MSDRSDRPNGADRSNGSDGVTDEFKLPLKSTLEKIRNQPFLAAVASVDDKEEPVLYCGRCEFGWIIENGRARRCICNTRRGVGSRQDVIEMLLKRHRAGISKKLASVSSHTFLVRPGHEHIKLSLDKYIADLEAGKKYGFFIFGETGVGKSYAAAYVINTVRHKRIMIAAMINFSRTLTALRSTFKDEEEHQNLLSVLYDTPLLAIDDLGMEHRVGENPDVSWAVSKFYEVIDYRRDSELATIITSNRTPDKLAERLGEPIMTRIKNLTLRLDIAPLHTGATGWGE